MKRTGCGCALLLLFIFLGPLAFASPSSDTPSDAVVQSPGPRCAPAVHCQQPVSELAYVPAGFYPDGFVTPPGECTSWAAALWPGHHGRGVTWWGDAWEWFTNAAAQGYTVAQSPSVGAIVVFARGHAAATAFGHVAVVVQVSDGAVGITEMNLNHRFVVDRRTVSRTDPRIVGYIPIPEDAFT